MKISRHMPGTEKGNTVLYVRFFRMLGVEAQGAETEKNCCKSVHSMHTSMHLVVVNESALLMIPGASGGRGHK